MSTEPRQSPRRLLEGGSIAYASTAPRLRPELSAEQRGTSKQSCVEGQSRRVGNAPCSLDRTRTRALEATGLHSRNLPRFPRPPLSSRTVGFPESGWRARHFPVALPMVAVAKALTCMHPSPPLFDQQFDPSFAIGTARRRSWSQRLLALKSTMSESPFAPGRRYLLGGNLVGYLEGRYPFFVAQTNSCVKP